MIREEASLLLVSVIWGAAMAAAYDVLRILRRAVRHGTLAVAAEDFLYWICASFALFYLLLSQNDGSIRWYVLAGAAAWLVLSYGAATVLALLVCRRCGCLERGMAKGIAAFGLFMASWLPLQVASLFHPATSWREIGHGRSVAVGKAA